MFFTKTFLFNFLCSTFSSLCDLNYPYPEIIKDGNNGRRNEGDYSYSSSPMVKTKSGDIMGYFMTTTEGRQIYAFEGIPYAEPPINELRFEPPMPVKPWSNVLKATKPPPVCLQVNPANLFRVVGNENCLFLSIYTAKIPGIKNLSSDDGRHNNNTENSGTGLLPVLVWIHGGAFSFGYSGDYGPAYLLNHDIVLVTVNYRPGFGIWNFCRFRSVLNDALYLQFPSGKVKENFGSLIHVIRDKVGILGFLSTNDTLCPGNNGLKDQNLALKWINENIESFGGSTKNITLMGQSAGGVSVHLHLLSKMSQNYFQAAISLSGTAFVHWALQTPQQAARLRNQMAMILRCPTSNTTVLLQCFKHQNPVFLVANQLNMEEWIPFPSILFGPVIESPSSSSSFLSKSPEAVYAANEAAKIPWITSTTSQEGYVFLLFLKGLLRLKSYRQNWHKLAPLALNYKYFVTDQPELTTRRIKQFYLGNKDPMDASLDELGEVFSDRYFTFGFEKGIQAHSKVAKTYGYIWKYKGQYNIANSIGIPSSKWGVGHGEDMFFLFNSSSSYPGFNHGDSAYKLSKIFLNLLHNFFAQGEPLYSQENGTKAHVWDAVETTDVKKIEYLQLDHDIKMIRDPYRKKTEFWLSLNLSDTQQ